MVLAVFSFKGFAVELNLGEIFSGAVNFDTLSTFPWSFE